MRGVRDSISSAVSKTLESRMARPAALAAAFVLATGCSDRTKSAPMDSDLSRDLALAGKITSQPTFEDTALSSPAASAPAAQSKPRPTVRPASRQRPTAIAPVVTPQPSATVTLSAPAPAPAAASAQIAAGTGISMTAGGRVCTASNRPGDKIVATVDAPVTGSNGAVIPAGSKVVLEVASVMPGQSPEQSQLVFHVRALYVNDAPYSVSGELTPTGGLERAKIAGNPGADKKKVIGGAIAGAILGQVMGHSTKSTVIGAAAGAAAGTVASKAGERYEGCLAEGAPLRLILAQPVTME